jgi:hypothetical protein
VIPKLSDEAWVLLGLLYRGRRRTPGFRKSYEELRAHGLAKENRITEKGETALCDKYQG